MTTNDEHIVPRFFVHTMPDEKATREQGRPIYKDMECVEIRTPGDKLSVKVFPAHDVWKYGEIDGIRQPITYAMRFAEQYKRFKAQEAQVMSGTPLEELPFLTQAKRSELKALSIYTAEQLSALDGQPLKQLGIGGRELKEQARAYIERARDHADVSRLAAENARLQAQIEALKAGAQREAAPPADAAPFEDMDEEAMKEWLKDATGSRPRGTPSRETLLRMCAEANAELAAKKAQEAA